MFSCISCDTVDLLQADINKKADDFEAELRASRARMEVRSLSSDLELGSLCQSALLTLAKPALYFSCSVIRLDSSSVIFFIFMIVISSCTPSHLVWMLCGRLRVKNYVFSIKRLSSRVMDPRNYMKQIKPQIMPTLRYCIMTLSKMVYFRGMTSVHRDSRESVHDASA